MTLSLSLTGAQVLMPDGPAEQPLALAGGRIVETAPGREVDLSGFLILPGIVDIHGDAFEKHLAPRRGAMKDLDEGLIAAEAEIASNGITTATLAQFYSWEGGMRGPEFAGRVCDALALAGPRLGTDLRVQLRFEISMLEDYAAVQALIKQHGIGYVVFNDHLPHEELANGKRPPRLTGQSLRIGKNPDRHFEDLLALHAGMTQVPAALEGLTAVLAQQGILMGSHDDRTADQRRDWHRMGIRIAEFPETAEAAETTRAMRDGVILGAPNLVRGGSHKGNVSALELVTMGLCDALASDYHYPSLRRAVFLLADAGVLSLAGAWGLISSGPARLLGLADRGTLDAGKRADLVILDSETRMIGATISGGRITYMQGDAAARFLG